MLLKQNNDLRFIIKIEIKNSEWKVPKHNYLIIWKTKINIGMESPLETQAS